MLRDTHGFVLKKNVFRTKTGTANLKKKWLGMKKVIF